VLNYLHHQQLNLINMKQINFDDPTAKALIEMSLEQNIPDYDLRYTISAIQGFVASAIQCGTPTEKIGLFIIERINEINTQ
tara:strand:- start:277 stop:519 length:243 start_codon:yes stop_codon:yes gene_type:complete